MMASLSSATFTLPYLSFSHVAPLPLLLLHIPPTLRRLGLSLLALACTGTRLTRLSAPPPTSSSMSLTPSVTPKATSVRPPVRLTLTFCLTWLTGLLLALLLSSGLNWRSLAFNGDLSRGLGLSSRLGRWRLHLRGSLGLGWSLLGIRS